MPSKQRKQASKQPKHLITERKAARAARWRDFVVAYVAAQPGESFYAQCKAAGELLGISYKTVSNYAGGPEGETPRATLPRPDALAEVCAVTGWNVNFVLFGPPHPEYARERLSRVALEDALADRLTTAMADAQAAGDLPVTTMSELLRSLPGAVHHPARFAVDGHRALDVCIANTIQHAREVADEREERWSRVVNAYDAKYGLEVLARAGSTGPDAARLQELLERLARHTEEWMTASEGYVRYWFDDSASGPTLPPVTERAGAPRPPGPTGGSS